MTRKTTHTTTIQCWPGGQSYVYRGDLNGPANQRSLRHAYTDQQWRKGLPEEWKQIEVSTLAEQFGRAEIFCCDSSLIDDLLKLGASGEGGELADVFVYEDIRNIYKDTSDWDADQCREYASDHGLDLPEVPESNCDDCDGRGYFEEPSRHDCKTCKGTGTTPDADYETDENPIGGWLHEARNVCRDHAQENPAEIYEWYRVSPWLCEKLHKIGEATIDNGYGCWWGRTCSGQALIMDGTMQQIASDVLTERAR